MTSIWVRPDRRRSLWFLLPSQLGRGGWRWSVRGHVSGCPRAWVSPTQSRRDVDSGKWTVDSGQLAEGMLFSPLFQRVPWTSRVTLSGPDKTERISSGGARSTSLDTTRIRHVGSIRVSLSVWDRVNPIWALGAIKAQRSVDSRVLVDHDSFSQKPSRCHAHAPIPGIRGSITAG